MESFRTLIKFSNGTISKHNIIIKGRQSNQLSPIKKKKRKKNHTDKNPSQNTYKIRKRTSINTPIKNLEAFDHLFIKFKRI